MTMALAFLKRDVSLSLSYRLSFLLQTGGILLSVTSFYFIAQLFGGAVAPKLNAYGGDYFAFVLIGMALFNYMGLGLHGLAGTVREGQTQGTLELMLLTPSRLSAILLSSSIWSYLLSTFQIGLYLLLGAVVFKADLSQANILSAFLVLVVSVASFSAIGIVSAAFVLVLKKGDPVTWVFSSASGLLGGLFFPVSVLPDWLQNVSSFVPLTYSLNAMRLAVLKGYSYSQLLPDLLVLAAFGAALLPVSFWLFRIALKRAKNEGSLSQY